MLVPRPHPKPLNQKLWEGGAAICVLTNVLVYPVLKFEIHWTALGILYDVLATWFNWFHPCWVTRSSVVSGAAHSVVETLVLQFFKMKSASLWLLPVALELSFGMTQSKSKSHSILDRDSGNAPGLLVSCNKWLIAPKGTFPRFTIEYLGRYRKGANSHSHPKLSRRE